MVIIRKNGKMCVDTEETNYVDYTGNYKGLEIRKVQPFKKGKTKNYFLLMYALCYWCLFMDI